MEQCYQCAGAVGADGARVCGTCLRRELGDADVRSTAEFSAVMPAADPLDTSAPPEAGGSCAWCGKDGGSVQKLLGNGAVAICNQCVALCAEVMQAELGDGWRG
jgi:hypothetical protein